MCNLLYNKALFLEKKLFISNKVESCQIHVIYQISLFNIKIQKLKCNANDPLLLKYHDTQTFI
jgi:hypothetical protein